MTNTIKQDRWERLLKMLGWGDVNSAKVWFIGIEEALGKEEIDEFDNHLYKGFCVSKSPKDASKDKHGYRKTPIYVVISKVIMGLEGGDWEKDWRNYRDNLKFSAAGGPAVQTNLFPLGKPNVGSWNKLFEEALGLDRDRYYAQMRDPNNSRFTMIRNQRQQHGNPLTICFGSTFWSDFKSCLGITAAPQVEADGYFQFFVPEKVVLTPFFAPRGRAGMSNARIELLISLLNKKGLNPFA